MKVKSPATVDDLLRMPEDGNKYELVDGEILVSPAGMRHSKVAAQICYLLKRFLETSPIGEVYAADVGIRLPNGNVRSPDCCYVSKEKLPGGESPESYGELVPDLVVEVLSPGDNLREVADKIGEYLQCGVPLLWLVDPRQRTVTVYRSLTDTRRLQAQETIDAEPVLPGFRCEVAQFF